MVKVTGIDIGSSHIHLVEVDGSARRYKISSLVSYPRSQGGLEEGEAADSIRKSSLVDDLARAFDLAGAERTNTLLALSASHCVLRNIKMPFRGKGDIDKVLKFEAESYIHSHSIDDVVVDCSVVEESDTGTELFMVAHPKAELGENLKALNKVGVDPQVCDLDACLLVGAAKASGWLSTQPTGDAGTEPGEEEPRPKLILDMGYSSTQIILVQGERLVASRCLRWGLDRFERLLADGLQVSAGEVHEALERHFGIDRSPAVVPEDGSEFAEGVDPDFAATEQAVMGAAFAPDLATASRAPQLKIGLSELSDASAALAASLFREITRFMAGQKLAGELSSILVSGGGSKLPGFIRALGSESDAAVETLDLIGDTEKDPELVLPAPQLNLAYAAAMAGIGASSSLMNFRQEELSFKRKFDQLKFPLALFTLLLAILLFFMNLILLRGIQRVEWSIGVEHKAPVRGAKARKGRPPKTVNIWTGLLYDLATDNRRTGRIRRVLGQKHHSDYEKRLRAAEPMNRLVETKSFLVRLKKKLETETGFHSELKLESGLSILQAFSAAIDKADSDKRLERFIITKLNLHVGVKRNRNLDFTIAFEGEQFREQKAIFAQIMKSCCGGKGPFESVNASRETQITNSIYRATYLFTFTLKRSIEVFQPQ